MEVLWLVSLLTPITYAISVIEAGILSYFLKKSYDWHAACANWACGLGKTIVYLFPYSIHVPIFRYVWDNRIFDLSITSEVNLKNTCLVIALLVGQDFCYYWSHRVSHHVRWFWANHVVHHSSAQLNLSAAFRNGWFTKYNGTYLFLIPLIWLGFSPWLVLFALFLNVYQFIIHNTWTPRLGWLEYVFNTPSSHRVHHAKNSEYINANFGGIFIVFDIMFGTYVAEKKEIPCQYGVENRETDYNPINIELIEWKHFYRDLKSSKNLGEALNYLIKAPDWMPARYLNPKIGPDKKLETEKVS